MRIDIPDHVKSTDHDVVRSAANTSVFGLLKGTGSVLRVLGRVQCDKQLMEQ